MMIDVLTLQAQLKAFADNCQHEHQKASLMAMELADEIERELIRDYFADMRRRLERIESVR